MQELIFPFETFKFIYEQGLCYVDMASFRSTCKILNNLRLPSFKAIFQLKLEEYVKSENKDLATIIYDVLLVKNAGVISGSFLLDCLYDTNTCNDIDCFIEADSRTTKKIYDELKLHHYFKKLDKGYDISEFITITLATKIQIVSVKIPTDKIHDFVVKCSDLDFCRNTFDGRSLKIGNWNSLFERKSYFYPTINLRWNKWYEGEAFGIVKSVKDSLSRMGKYKDRGFEVQIHPEDTKLKRELETQFLLHKCDNMFDAYNVGMFD